MRAPGKEAGLLMSVIQQETEAKLYYISLHFAKCEINLFINCTTI